MDYTIRDLERWSERIEDVARDVGLDFYDQEFEIINYRDMIAYEAYVGMPSRYPHWSFGKAYEKTRTLYKFNLTGLPYEMVINSNPCLAYLMNENTLLIQILTIAHVYGHNDFFKNNRLFREGICADYTIGMFKTHADIIRSYANDPSIGYESVEGVIDSAHAIKIQTSRVVGEKRLSYETMKRNILEDYKKKSERYNILEPYTKPEPPKIDKVPLEPEEDLLYFIIEYGDLKEWEKNVLEIVRKETQYFIPQIETKIMNEGWASYWHYNILKKLELPEYLNMEFIKRHNDVIAQWSGSLNPYFLGFKVFEDIHKRYGKDKIFEVRSIERDESFIRRYLTEELCMELNLFSYVKQGKNYVIEDISDEAGWKNIRNILASSCGMGMVPYIRVIDMSRKDKTLILEHVYDGRELNMDYAESTLKHIVDLWGHTVILKTKLGGREIKIVCDEYRKISHI
ncbi:SpoVR family protein [Fonticella tunisiensis]|uniref:Stage V sporulation protein R n=1 Tax=Fonticella tunisiensis TaxID=1096341 RepID=A0A4R7KBR4_9CLOT|nr:SpoVR family protein [Fonticella tunisiensis]TDT51231.1 stage V sporulation protein R [Fonticella tunisiensis]